MPRLSGVLVVNAGSSSLKYQLVDPTTGACFAKGLIERIGLDAGVVHHEVDGQRHVLERDVADHAAAVTQMTEAFTAYGPDLGDVDLLAVGHRVVHGGQDFADPTLVTDEVLATVERLIPLAPLHNPGNLQGIRATQSQFPDVPQVAVFDTAFHQTMPAAASTYAVPRAWREEHRVRRYGFHGTSHAYVSRRAAELLGRPLEELATVVLHLGNGASATAVDGGRSVDTSMGLTPLEGLVMGTRPGDLDPGLARHLHHVAGLTVEDYDRALSKESGLLGLSGSADMRQVQQRRAAGDPDAQLAFDVVVHRLLHYVGGYAAVLGRLDALVFTAGIGENDAQLRAAVVERLAGFGVELDVEANGSGRGERRISTDASRVAVLVVPTNEEWEIARQAAEVVHAR
ncbi:acetate/propionate family kinase [Ornithinimicrobium tianjinense]|uniref:Acetate kinase n=1 Tax=Ornithinimicrobium tianjinense TaxID=1195761 RepID=A0A917F5W0_9MICO|nr:acetate kinase [Ornithinimicrobium tianjinense]GGF46638.1 acetate kinase [Ornithinimicrobium tianjinense]